MAVDHGQLPPRRAVAVGRALDGRGLGAFALFDAERVKRQGGEVVSHGRLRQGR